MPYRNEAEPSAFSGRADCASVSYRASLAATPLMRRVSCEPDHMAIFRLILAVVSLALALFCGGEAYLIHHWNIPPKHWLFAGPLNVYGVTMSPSTAIAALGLLAFTLLLLAAYAFFGFKSSN
jgi:hypothetical protein